ncbi:MAG: DUF2807 domain-containing protein [Fluviicola sp.]|nr:DUF2807 domain-containing protein [Fluviicola sp.]
MKSIFFFFVFLTLLFSCKKPENRTCFKSVGSIIEKEIKIGSFNKLRLNEHLKYVLIQDSTDKIILKGGENLLNHIHFKLADNTIEITNKNKCRFLRNYSKKVIIEIHFTSLINIEIIGSETLTNNGALNLDLFSLTISDGAGSVDLKNINANVFETFLTGGNGDFTLSGKANFAHFIVNGNGFCNTNNFIAIDSLAVITNSSAPVKVNANNTFFRTEIKRNGDLYYIGSPLSIKNKEYSSGKLINAN